MWHSWVDESLSGGVYDHDGRFGWYIGASGMVEWWQMKSISSEVVIVLEDSFGSLFTCTVV